METAINLTDRFFPDAFYTKSNGDILFRLKCRKWIELIRRSNDLSRPIDRRKSRTYSTASNGNGFRFRRTKGAVDDVFDQDMELDEDEEDAAQDHKGSFQNGMDGNVYGEDIEADHAKGTQLLKEAIEYGTELMRDYGHGYQREVGPREARHLTDIFSLIAYDDAKESVHGHLLDPAGRVVVAEELNSAILGMLYLQLQPIFRLHRTLLTVQIVSLGRSSSAALERLYKQTEALIAELSQDGGPAAFVNLQEPKPL